MKIKINTMFFKKNGEIKPLELTGCEKVGFLKKRTCFTFKNSSFKIPVSELNKSLFVSYKQAKGEV